MSASHVEILEQRIVILEDTIQMLSYNLRCLNIRQGSQPIELREGVLKCTPDEFEHMVRNLVFNEHIECVKRTDTPFGQDETAWAK